MNNAVEGRQLHLMHLLQTLTILKLDQHRRRLWVPQVGPVFQTRFFPEGHSPCHIYQQDVTLTQSSLLDQRHPKFNKLGNCPRRKSMLIKLRMEEMLGDVFLGATYLKLPNRSLRTAIRVCGALCLWWPQHGLRAVCRVGRSETANSAASFLKSLDIEEKVSAEVWLWWYKKQRRKRERALCNGLTRSIDLS